jgi:hypothetical protein
MVRLAPGARPPMGPGMAARRRKGVTVCDADDLASALQAAYARLAAAPGLDRADSERLHRQFIAVCDAVKAPGADAATGRRRLDGFLDALDSVIAGKS